jgi:Undecaprenyl-phosphate galactose phosphotransferase WbaP
MSRWRLSPNTKGLIAEVLMQEATKKSSSAITTADSSTAEHSESFAPIKQHHASPQVAVVSNSFDRELLVSPLWGGDDRSDASSGRRTGIRQQAIAGTKRAFDVVAALILAVGLSPFILPLMLIMACGSGPIIYAHRRIGQGGKLFGCFKFRTMVPNADNVLYELLERNPALKAEWLRDHKLRDDPRVTRIGSLLRRTSLDELPQLWNVLRGDMSMVGPRPIVREELLRYGRNTSVLLSVKPGITGLWQVSGRNNTDYRRRVAIDVYYVRNQSIALDVYILLKTVRVVLGRDGAY